MAGFCALLASLAALFLVYVRVALLQDAPGLSSLIVMSFSGSAPRRQVWLDFLREAASAFRDRMHTTWLFFGVFAAVWLACLLWMQIERSRHHLTFSRHEAVWMAWMSLVVFSAAVFYGLGTNGIFSQPQLVTVSDVLALGFILALPVIAWSRLHRHQLQALDSSPEPARPRRNSGFLGLNDETVDARLVENLSLHELTPEVKTVEMLPAVQIFHERPSDHARAAADRLIESAESAVTPKPLEPGPAPVATALFPEAAKNDALNGIDGFRGHLATINNSWQNIEAIRGQIDDWFEQRRRQAIAHLDAHPGMRGSSLTQYLFNDFPGDKLAAVDAEWAEIRTAALEISRWFGDVPASDRKN